MLRWCYSFFARKATYIIFNDRRGPAIGTMVLDKVYPVRWIPYRSNLKKYALDTYYPGNQHKTDPKTILIYQLLCKFYWR